MTKWNEEWTLVNQDDACHRKIAETAYRRAEQRGFAPGHEQEDWFAAEQEIYASW